MKPIHRMTRHDMLTEIYELRKSMNVTADECYEFLRDGADSDEIAQLLIWLRKKAKANG